MPPVFVDFQKLFMGNTERFGNGGFPSVLHLAVTVIDGAVAILTIGSIKFAPALARYRRLRCCSRLAREHGGRRARLAPARSLLAQAVEIARQRFGQEATCDPIGNHLSRRSRWRARSPPHQAHRCYSTTGRRRSQGYHEAPSLAGRAAAPRRLSSAGRPDTAPAGLQGLTSAARPPGVVPCPALRY
jgi:hypothetical protein